MKPSFYWRLLVAFVAGGLATGLLLPHTGRYQLRVGDGYLVRFDTVTGKAWFEVFSDPNRRWIQVNETNIAPCVTTNEGPAWADTTPDKPPRN